MKNEFDSPEEYIAQLSDDRNGAVKKLRETILSNLPNGFEEVINYGMIGYVVPLSMYPTGYRNDPKVSLPYLNIASQKNFVAFYHMGLVANSTLLKWFVDEYPKHCKEKLDMGKSCVRFKKMDQIPYGLIGESVSQITPKEWIDIYEGAAIKNAINTK